VRKRKIEPDLVRGQKRVGQAGDRVTPIVFLPLQGKAKKRSGRDPAESAREVPHL